MPTAEQIAAEHEKMMLRIDAGDADPDKSLTGMFNVETEYHLLAGARYYDAKNRARWLSKLRSALADGDTSIIDQDVQSYIAAHGFETTSTSLKR